MSKMEATLSPHEWVAKHTQQYIETNGEEGYLFNGAPTLLLTTTGRSSGIQRITALIFGRDGDRYLIVASQGGADEHPQWYKNIEVHPEVHLQVRAEHLTARARTATPEEKTRLWPIMTAVWPAYDDYQKKTTRDIPLVILDPV